MRLYKCDVCGKILMIAAGERTVETVVREIVEDVESYGKS